MNIDVAAAFSRYDFLGYEFILWLWYLSEREPGVITEQGRTNNIPRCELTIGDSITVEIRGTGRPEILTIKGADAAFEEAFIALDKGGVVTRANMVLDIPEHSFSFTLEGATFFIRALKCRPDIERPAFPDEDEQQRMLIEKWYLNGVVFGFLDRMFGHFIHLRSRDAEWPEVYPLRIRQWVADMIRDGRDECRAE